MKILHYHKGIDLESGGVVRAVLDLCSGCAAAGASVTLLTWNDADVPDEWRRDDAPDGAVRAKRIPFPAGLGARATRAALEFVTPFIDEADVLHLHSCWDPTNLQLAKIARAKGVPYIHSVHGMLDDWSMAQRGPKKRVFLALGGRRTLEGAAAVHTTATAELEQAKKWFPKGHGVVIPLIFDLTAFRDLPGPAEADAAIPALSAPETLLFLSRIHYKKGVEHLIDAAAHLREAGRDTHVLIAGTGDDDYVAGLQARVKAQQLEDRVHFVGFVSGTKKVSLYQAADVFVLPTSQENFGFVLFEALAAGTPVVTTKGADTWPEMERSGGSVITEPNGADLAREAAKLLDDPERRARMGAAGRQWVLDNLAPEHVVASFMKLYARGSGRESGP